MFADTFYHDDNLLLNVSIAAEFAAEFLNFSCCYGGRVRSHYEVEIEVWNHFGAGVWSHSGVEVGVWSHSGARVCSHSVARD